MTFRYLRFSTTADPSDMNDNFYHIHQGSRLPMSGSMLAYTTGSKNIGDTNASWLTVYCKKFNLTAPPSGTLFLIAESIVTIATANINISGLNGDTDKLYIIKCIFIKATSSTEIVKTYFNNDTTSNYTWSYSDMYVSSNGIIYTSSSNYIPGYTDYMREILNTMTSFSGKSYGILDGFIYAATGFERPFMQNLSNLIDTSDAQIYIGGGVWRNTASTLTSIQFICNSGENNFDVGTTIQIWARR